MFHGFSFISKREIAAEVGDDTSGSRTCFGRYTDRRELKETVEGSRRDFAGGKSTNEGISKTFEDHSSFL